MEWLVVLVALALAAVAIRKTMEASALRRQLAQQSRLAGTPGDSSPAAARPGPPRSEAPPEVLQLIRAGKKIEAIKVYREAMGVGLKEAKEAVERIEAGR